MLDQRAPVFGYIDGPRFVASPTFKAILEAIRELSAQSPGAADPLGEIERSCGFNPLAAVREVTFSAEPESEEVTIVAALDRSAEQAFQCFASLGNPKPESLAGHTALCRTSALSVDPSQVVEEPGRDPRAHCLVARGDLLVFGERSRLGQLFAAFPAPSGTRPADGYLFVSSAFPNPLGVKRASLTLAPAAAGTRVGLEAQASSPEDAANLEAQARQLLALVPQRLASEPPELQRVVKTLLENLSLEHRGNTATATLTVEDSTLSGSLAALAVYGVKRYVTATKMELARSTVLEIAVRLNAHATEARDHRYPRSAPRVPAKVPAGTKYTTTAADWQHKSWTAIHFQPEEDQYYSYEYETSKDGKRATVRARGDLDGDGVESLFEADVKVEGNKAQSISPLRATNPTE